MAGREHLAQEFAQRGLQRGHLLGKALDGAASVDVALLIKPGRQAATQPVHQPVERVAERGHGRTRLFGLADGEGGAPHLRPVVATQIVEEFDEAVHQVGFGEQHIDRHPDLQIVGQLRQPLAHRAGVLGALHGVLPGDVGQAEGDHHAVDRPPAPVPLQQGQEAGPGGTVDQFVGILGGVAPGGVQDHRLLGEPPVAVARAADAANGVLAELVHQREFHARIPERGGLARPRRTDDHVPRQLIQIPPGTERTAAQTRLFQRGDGLAEALLQGGDLLGRGVRLGLSRRGGGGGDVGQHGGVGALAAYRHGHGPHRPAHDHHHDGDHPRHRPGQRLGPGDGDQRPDEPDQQRHEQQPQGGQHPAVQQPTEQNLQHRHGLAMVLLQAGSSRPAP